MAAKTALLTLLYPRKCVFCGKLMEAEGLACSTCGETLPVRTGSECARSGQWFRTCVSPFVYEGAAREVVLRFKYQHQVYCGVTLGRWMAECVHSQLALEDVDLITWVPTSRRRRWKRGFDQSEVLAEELARTFNIRLVCTMKKRRNNKPLSRTKGGWEVRRAQVSGLYGLSVEPSLLTGKRILLVDDVYTTGSTLEETSRLLREAGAAEVCCVTAARASRQEKKTEIGQVQSRKKDDIRRFLQKVCQRALKNAR